MQRIADIAVGIHMRLPRSTARLRRALYTDRSCSSASRSPGLEFIIHSFIQLGIFLAALQYMTRFLSEHGIILMKFRRHSAIAPLSIIPFAAEEGNLPAVAVELACAARKVALCAADQSG